MNKQFIDKQKLAEQFVKETGFSPGQLSIGVGYIDDLIDKQPVAFDMDMVIDQLEDYGKYKGILENKNGKCENYIPVSMAIKIVKAAGLNGVLGYLTKEDYFELDTKNNTPKRITITVNKSGDWSILRCGDEFETSGHRLSNWDWSMLLRQLGYEVEVIEVSNEKMESIQVKRLMDRGNI